MVTLYIFKKATGEYLYQDIGNPEYVIKDLGDDKDFTLTQPPSSEQQWYWYDNQWHDKPSI